MEVPNEETGRFAVLFFVIPLSSKTSLFSLSVLRVETSSPAVAYFSSCTTGQKQLKAEENLTPVPIRDFRDHCYRGVALAWVRDSLSRIHFRSANTFIYTYLSCCKDRKYSDHLPSIQGIFLLYTFCLEVLITVASRHQHPLFCPWSTVAVLPPSPPPPFPPASSSFHRFAVRGSWLAVGGQTISIGIQNFTMLEQRNSRIS